MKKTSLIAIAALLASTGAGAGTENPLYRPDAKRAYSITDISDSEHLFQAREYLGYGFTDSFAVEASFGYVDPDKQSYLTKGLDAAEFGLSYRYMKGKVLGDLYGRYGTNLDQDSSAYGKFNAYTVGTRVGSIKADYTVAGRVEYAYINPDALDNINRWSVGIAGLYRFAPKFSGMIDAEYADLDSGHDNDSSTFVTLQANYHIKGTLSAYYKTDVSDDEDKTYGLKYGVQF